MDGEWINAEIPELRAVDEAKRRLMRLGARSLSNAELIGVLIGTDELVRAASLVDDGLKALLSESPEALVEYRQLSEEEASRLLAAAELARRMHSSVEVCFWL